MPYKLLNDNLMVELENPENTTSSGLIVADEKPKDRGTVVAVGPDVLDISVGDKIVFKMTGAQEMEVDGKKCAIIVAEDVLVVVDA